MNNVIIGDKEVEVKKKKLIGLNDELLIPTAKEQELSDELKKTEYALLVALNSIDLMEEDINRLKEQLEIQGRLLNQYMPKPYDKVTELVHE